ncbi:hypothetical protein L3Q82_017645 [Scortum barcoo]|uniref:Uncharacterized protein n=1 Tax=Scortum barcoo TaxID=214431 RepID=A0ACB8VLZ2_9TELE|nr:hypothetical protein L3Q82_017645 [Scortum barcoo]
MAAAIASGLIRQKRQAREQHLDRPSTNRRRKSPNKNKGLCNGNLVDIFSKVRIFGLRKRRLRRQGLGTLVCKVPAVVGVERAVCKTAPDIARGHQDTLGWRSMIDFVVISSDLRLYVLDTQVKRGAELSTDHHLVVVSWIRWQRRKLDRPGRDQDIL